MMNRNYLHIYRKLSADLKAEIRGELHGILKTTQQVDQSVALTNEQKSN